MAKIVLENYLPRLPLVGPVEKFMAFANAGRELATLRLDYENAALWPDVLVKGAGHFRVRKMKFARKRGAWDKTRIIYNSDIEISNIPLQSYEYAVNGRSAIEWIMESYRIKTDKASGIVNDPNNWGREDGKPSYILDLLLAVIGLSMRTLEIVDSLLKLESDEEDSQKTN